MASFPAPRKRFRLSPIAAIAAWTAGAGRGRRRAVWCDARESVRGAARDGISVGVARTSVSAVFFCFSRVEPAP
eukprot:31331-Pelagococcus_subviridis.AAC.13